MACKAVTKDTAILRPWLHYRVTVMNRPGAGYGQLINALEVMSVRSQLSHATFLFMSGDRYPDDQYIETALCDRLPGLHLTYGALIERFADGAPPLGLAPRITFLRRILASIPTQNLILVGRSSGGRVITRLAAEFTDISPMAGIVCLGYPFRHPEKAHEPDRVDHLTRVSVPTLILQGDQDEYGDKSAALLYPLSTSTQLEFIAATHVLRLQPENWDALADRICRFAADRMSQPSLLSRTGSI